MDDNIELMHNCDKNHSCNFTSFLSAKENNKMVKIGDFCTEQAGCTVYIYICVYKKIVIERTRDLIYLKFVVTDFFPKIISPSAGENSGDLA